MSNLRLEIEAGEGRLILPEDDSIVPPEIKERAALLSSLLNAPIEIDSQSDKDEQQLNPEDQGL